MTQDIILHKLYSLERKICCILDSNSIQEGTLSSIRYSYNQLKNLVTTGMPFNIQIQYRLRKIERKLRKIECIVCGSNGTVNIAVTTFTGVPAEEYPLGVFNINGDYLGIANDQDEFISLWNADVDNQTQGTLAAGSTQFQFTLPEETVTISNVVGLRWWQFNVLANRRVKVLLDTQDVIVSPDGQHNGSTGTVQTPTQLSGGTLFGSQPRVLFGSNVIDRTYVNAGTVYVFHNEGTNSTGFLDTGITGFTGGVTNYTGNLPRNTTQIMIQPSTSSAANLSTILNWLELTNTRCISALFWNSGQANFTTIPLFHHMPLIRNFVTYYGTIPLPSWGLTDANIFPNLEVLGFTFPVSGQSPSGDWSNVSTTLKYTSLGGGVGGTTQADTEHIAVSLAANMTAGAAPQGVKAIQFVNTGYTTAAQTAKTTLQSKGYTVSP